MRRPHRRAVQRANITPQRKWMRMGVSMGVFWNRVSKFWLQVKRLCVPDMFLLRYQFHPIVDLSGPTSGHH